MKGMSVTAEPVDFTRIKTLAFFTRRHYERSTFVTLRRTKAATIPREFFVENVFHSSECGTTTKTRFI